MPKLVIVESPAKARTIEKYLGKDFKVAASVGHVVDLPRKDLGVDVKNDFKPSYEVMPEKKKQAAALKKAAEGADEIFLAPDPDREGEAIAWHLANLLKKAGRPMRRVLINEITKPAVIKAIQNAGAIDQDRFEAQQARRILDRLVGYLISPMLSKKFHAGLSAGRVQSVALRLVVERERAIRAFVVKEYWSIHARLAAKVPPEFTARLVAIDGKTLEAPERFDKDTNEYLPLDPAKAVFIPDGEAARRIIAELEGQPFVVGEVVRQERRRNPLPPFITSTLQQEAARKLGFAAKKTMSLAQNLYQGIDVGEGAVGLITYMRTDSPRLADEAVAMIRDHVARVFGRDYLPPSPPSYKSRKGAQEAHEAIRPTAMDRTPDLLRGRLDPDLARLYELIFLRALASQMKPAVYDQTTIEFPVGRGLFRATGRVIKFKGFLAAYEEAVDDDAAVEEEAPLPPLEPGDRPRVEELAPEQHFTRPPPRFSEASLVRELEERGIGRPSTYASILSTIQERRYVEKEQKRFIPTDLGEKITDVLVEAFPKILDVKFTAQMEDDLDRIEDGKEKWVELLSRFYGPFEQQLKEAEKIIGSAKEKIPTDIPCPSCGAELLIKTSAKSGRFLGCSAYPKCKFTSDFVEEGGEVRIVERGVETAGLACEKCGAPMVIKKTRKDGREFLACSAYPKCDNTRDFRRDEQGAVVPLERKTVETSGIVCEKCGQPMVVKRTRVGGREFLSCSGYPKCKNAKDFKLGEDGSIIPVEREQPEAIDLACDKCGKPMAIKRTRIGAREFLACTGYPKCKNAKDFIRDPDGKVRIIAPGDPGAPCPKCGKPLILKRGRGGATYWACETKDCAGPERPKAAAAPKATPEPLPDEPPCEKCGSPMIRRQGRFGPFIACSGYPQCKNIRKKK